MGYYMAVAKAARVVDSPDHRFARSPSMASHKEGLGCFSPSLQLVAERVDERSKVGVSKVGAMQFEQVILRASHVKITEKILALILT